jgi:hypothetical protein
MTNRAKDKEANDGFGPLIQSISGRVPTMRRMLPALAFATLAVMILDSYLRNSYEAKNAAAGFTAETLVAFVIGAVCGLLLLLGVRAKEGFSAQWRGALGWSVPVMLALTAAGSHSANPWSIATTLMYMMTAASAFAATGLALADDRMVLPNTRMLLLAGVVTGGTLILPMLVVYS